MTQGAADTADTDAETRPSTGDAAAPGDPLDRRTDDLWERAVARGRAAAAGWDPGRLERHLIPLGLLAVAVIAWLAVFIPLAVNQQRHYLTFDYDLGIFDQSTWLLAHGRGFITVRGLDFLGHHMNLGLLLFVPAYWLGAGPEFLQVMGVLALAASVIPILLLCRHYRPGHSWYGLVFSTAFLYGAVPQNLVQESFHPDMMAIPFMLLAFWASVKRRWGLYALFVVLTLCWKEDLSFFVFMLGLGVFIKRDRDVGLLTMAGAAAYFLLVTKVILPGFSGDAFYSSFLGDLGNSPGQLASTLVNHPGRFADRYHHNDGAGYFLGLQVPWFFTGLLSPSTLLLGLPAYLVNVLSIEGYTQDLARHYVGVPFTATVISAIRGLHSRSTALMRAGLAAGIVVMTLFGLAGGTGPWGNRYDIGIWALDRTPRMDTFDRAVDLVPEGARVSASYKIVPHLTRRAEIYTFPNPWQASNWGIKDRDPRSPTRIQWLVVDTTSLQPDTQALLKRISSSRCWEERLNKDDVVVLRRTGTDCRY